MGLTFDKIAAIAVIALFLIGPEKLPDAAERLAGIVRRVRQFTSDAKERVREEVGPEFDEVDWASLDPRRYDPRRIIQEALIEPLPKAPTDRPSRPEATHQPEN